MFLDGEAEDADWGDEAAEVLRDGRTCVFFCLRDAPLRGGVNTSETRGEQEPAGAPGVHAFSNPVTPGYSYRR